MAAAANPSHIQCKPRFVPRLVNIAHGVLPSVDPISLWEKSGPTFWGVGSGLCHGFHEMLG